ncbi:delta-class carbonic anhydrase [Marinibacterium sp. SX1]|uniref:delta-class carbonic anhydrase n=1 Tax=Marinibacterium sp. SX1 TaxID=3388424 RepID=UPI003D16C581
MAGAALALCQDYGPQTPRDISNTYGRNGVRFDFAPPAAEMNLCNIHTHTNAEHMGPGFSVYAGPGESGGFRCTGSNRLSVAELTRPGEEMPATHGDDNAGTDHAGHDADQDAGHVTRTSGGHGVELPRSGGFHGVQPGDTIEVHWVYSTCPVDPGPGLGACLSEGCANPQLRVESQVFLVVNDPNALDFMDFVYRGTMRSGLHQPRSLPTGTGNPVVFRGSTTGPSYSEDTCSPLQVTWSVRPRCARLDITTLDEWAMSGNIFEETHSHGVRQLVTAPELLAPID